jgi:hypothetical protein
MKLESYDIGRWAAWYECACGVHNASICADTHRGAAIKAGRAMRAIVRAVEVRISKARIDGLWAGRRAGGNAAVMACYLLLCNNKLTRRQIKERLRQETNQ